MTLLRHLAIALTAAGLTAAAAPGSPLAPRSADAAELSRPARVYVVSLDGLGPDEVALMPRLSAMAAEGYALPESRAVMVAETIPNHVAMVTGVYPDRTGIVANNFPVTGGEPGFDVTEGSGGSLEAGDPRLLRADSVFTLAADQCPDLVTASVNSKDYLETIMAHDRNGDGRLDPDTNFSPTSEPTFIPGLGLTPDETTMAEALRVSTELDPHYLFLNLGSIDRVGHVDETGGLTRDLPTGAAPAGRRTQLVETDRLLGQLVDQLQGDGRWATTAMLITADHSMDWSRPDRVVSLTAAFEADPLLRDQVVFAQNGGAALYSLKDRTAPQAAERLRRMRAVAVARDGVDEALYRVPNALDGGERHTVGRAHPDWHQTSPRSGDLLLTVEDGWRVSEPQTTSSPIPGNHGMTSTLRIPMVVTGGLGVRKGTATPPRALSPAERDPAQGENVDLAPTAAWLLGLAPPSGGFDGRVLSEAFTRRPAAACTPRLPVVTARTGSSVVTAGNSPVVEGTVVRAGNAVVGTEVEVLARPYGTAAYVEVGRVRTTAGGRWRLPVRPDVQTAYVARAAGSSSVPVLVRVATRVTVTGATAGTVSGTVLPLRGTTIGLAVQDGTAFRFVTATTAGPDGRFTLRAPRDPGRTLFAYVSARGGNDRGSRRIP